MEVSELSEIWRRELGFLQPRSFAHRVGGSEAVVKRLDLYGKLHGHKGCVNTIHFSPSGDLLVSGSDDKDIRFWNCSTRSEVLTYYSGHDENVFEAQIMPYTDDRTVVTSAADGQKIEDLMLIWSLEQSMIVYGSKQHKIRQKNEFWSRTDSGA